MQAIKQSDPRAAFRRVYFTCVDTAALQTRLAASDMSTFTVKISKNGGTPASPAASAPVEVGATDQKGIFYVPLAAADVDTAGSLTIKITNTGGTKTMEPREIVVQIEQAFMASVVSGLSVTSFTVDRTETVDNHFKNAYVEVLSGACAGQVAKIGGYVGSSKLCLLAGGFQFTSALATGDVVEFINR